MSSLTRKQIVDLVDCPTCRSLAGSPCVKKGRAKNASHRGRLLAAQKAAGLTGNDRNPKAPKQRRSKTGFYSSWEWKKVRYDAIKIFEQRCMCCGWQPGDTPKGFLVVDHIKPRSKYPKLELDLNNLQVLCNDCNMGKSNDSEDDWRSMDERYKATIGY